MRQDDQLTEIVNKSGFPLQIAVENHINKTTSTHGWKVLHTEHSWINNINGESGFIDLIVENQFNTAVLIIECKRLLDTEWIFLLDQTSRSSSRRHVKSWITIIEHNSARVPGWSDVSLDPASAESQYCIVPGQDNKSRPMLERLASQTVSATEAFAQEEKSYLIGTHTGIRIYCNVIVTTATLKVCNFDIDSISLNDGKIGDVDFEDVPYVRFRKQLTVRKYSDSSNGFDISREKENTVFIVNSNSLVDFLRYWKIDNSALRPYIQNL